MRVAAGAGGGATGGGVVSAGAGGGGGRCRRGGDRGRLRGRGRGLARNRLDRRRRLQRSVGHGGQRGRGRARAATLERRLEPADPGQQRLRRGVDLGRRGLHQRELEPGPRVRAVLHRAHRGAEQLEQPHEVRRLDALRLVGQPRVPLGRHAQLRGNGAERAHDEQLTSVRLDVAHPGDEIATGGGERRGDPQRDPGVVRRDGVERAEQQVVVDRAEHRLHVADRDGRPRVGDELLERAERVAEGPGGVPREQRQRVGRDLDALLRPRRAAAPTRAAPRSAGRSRSGGSGRRRSAAPSAPRSWRARRSFPAAAPRAS